jgi:hypothetical protein
MCGAPVRDITHITPLVTGISGGVAIIGVAIRCIATAGHFALDDIFAIAALVNAIPMGILEFIMSNDGFGKDIWTIPPAKIYRIVQASIAIRRRWPELIKCSSPGSQRYSTLWQSRSPRSHSCAFVFASFHAKSFASHATHFPLYRLRTGWPSH